MELNSKNVRKILLIILFGAAVFTAMQNLSAITAKLSLGISFFRPVIIALCVAFVLNVLLTALETKVFFFMENSRRKFVKKLRRPLCLMLTYLIAFGIIIVLILVILPDISQTIVSLAERLPSLMNNARLWFENLLENFNLSQNLIPNIKINWNSVSASIKNYLSNDSNRIFGSAVGITTSVFSGVYDTVFSILISVYILAQKERIGGFISRFINAFIHKKQRDVIYHIAAQTYLSFSRFIGGQLTESVILGVLCFIGMTIFRFPNAPIISAFIGVTSLIPIIGATVGVILGFLLIVISSPIKALLFIVFFFVLQQLEGTLIYPRVVGKSVGLPGVIVVCAVLVGGNIGGIFGALVSVPAAAVLFVLIKEAIEKRTPHPIITEDNPDK